MSTHEWFAPGSLRPGDSQVEVNLLHGMDVYILPHDYSHLPGEIASRAAIAILVAKLGGFASPSRHDGTRAVIGAVADVRATNAWRGAQDGKLPALDVFHPSWLLDMYNARACIELQPEHVVLGTAETQRTLRRVVDAYGDHHTRVSSLTELRGVLERMAPPASQHATSLQVALHLIQDFDAEDRAALAHEYSLFRFMPDNLDLGNCEALAAAHSQPTPFRARFLESSADDEVLRLGREALSRRYPGTSDILDASTEELDLVRGMAMSVFQLQFSTYGGIVAAPGDAEPCAVGSTHAGVTAREVVAESADILTTPHVPPPPGIMFVPPAALASCASDAASLAKTVSTPPITLLSAAWIADCVRETKLLPTQPYRK
ncbi:MAG: hypothetical protein EOO65_01185 [Methanosarcinales archaeon]|nr:MAG: hypothetical protein EOO65_01185 [Methanosarcinales archaeon]